MREPTQRDHDDEQDPGLEDRERVDRAARLRRNGLPNASSFRDAPTSFIRVYPLGQSDDSRDRHALGRVARGLPDAGAELELCFALLITKDLQSEEANGPDEGSERSTGLRERAQRVEEGLLAHFAFGSRGSTVSGRQVKG